MKVKTLLKVLDDTKKITIIDPYHEEVFSYRNSKSVGIGFLNVRVVMVTPSIIDTETINIVVKRAKQQESDEDDKG